ncbi:MAG: hypothetical protein AAF135_03100 [Bacteroidota bacterium]
MQRIVGILGLVMGGFFIFFGIFFAIQKPDVSFLEEAPGWYYFMLGLAVVAYGGFRIYRSIKLIQRK